MLAIGGGIQRGDRFGTLTVCGMEFMARSGNRGKKRRSVVVRCDCGDSFVILSQNLKPGVRCEACYRKILMARSTKHGKCRRKSPDMLYRTWKSMIQRCSSVLCSGYENYGGRGIRVCQEWLGPHGFENFAAHVGPIPTGKTIDRIDNDGNYEPGNVRWATKSEQMKNRRPYKIKRRK